MSIRDWTDIEQAWKRSVTQAICEIAASYPNEEIYAGAFWLLYGDYSCLHAPIFGLNAESHAVASADADGTLIGLRWHPPDWRWAVMDPVVEAMKPLYKPFLKLDVSDAEFEELWEGHERMLARVCIELTEAVRQRRLGFEGATLPERFFVGIIDGAQGDDYERLLRLSVAEESLVRFPELVHG
jgi:hypothetical protein